MTRTARTRSWMRSLLPEVVLALLAAASWTACWPGGQAVPGPADAAAPDAEEWVLPPPEAILDPATYDCRVADTPPGRASPVPIGCFWKTDCHDWIIVAHRGGSYFAPENTLTAVRGSIVLGIDMVEVDIRLTADGQLVLMHDDTVDRTTYGRGKVSDYTLDEIQSLELKVNSQYPADMDLSCEHVPSFRELLELCKGRMDIMVDAKEGAEVAAQLVREMGMKNQVIILAGQDALEEARAAFPDVRIMVRAHSEEDVDLLWQAFDPSPDVIHLDHTFADESLVAHIHDDLRAKTLIDVFGSDFSAVLTGDLSGYVRDREMGIDLTQSEWAFLVMVAAGRLELP